MVIANQKNVYNLAVSITCNEQDALDVSQEVFLKAYTKLNSFRGTCKFSTWLYKITYNVSLDVIKNNKNNKNNLSLTCLNQWNEETTYDIPDVRFTPEEIVEQEEIKEDLVKAFNQLSPEYIEVLTLREKKGMSYNNIAENIGVSVGTIKSRIHRGRRALVKILIENQIVEIGV